MTRKRDGTFTLNLADDEQALLTALAEQLDPLLDDPSADPGLRRLFPPARTDDLLAEAQWEIEQGGNLRDARRAALEVVRAPEPGPLSEDAVVAWVQGINALRLVLGERLEVDGDQRAEEGAFDRALELAEDPDRPAEERDRALRIVHMWQVYELLGAMVAHAVRALD
ncbi:MAG TPA: DUF2017 family protein [Iamia sp.]|nr:DUF2017 family protein [Iamia sp.]